MRHMSSHACACVPCCMQAGSGKSHTLFGSGSETGLVPRCVSELFKVVDKEQRNATFIVTCSMLGLAQVCEGWGAGVRQEQEQGGVHGAVGE